MSSKVKENISALIDGQPDTGKTFDKLKQDSKLAECFGRYHLIGDAMRNELPAQLNLDIADQIAQAIEKEPVVLAPNAKHTAVEQTASDKGKSNKVLSFFRPAMQYGLAASFAAALVVGFQAEEQAVHVPQPVLQTFPIGGALDPVSMQEVEAYPSINSNEAALQRQRINAYIMDHAQQLKTRQYNSFESAEESQPEQVKPPVN